MLYKGYIETKGKAAVEKFKNKTRFKTYEQVRNLPGFGGVPCYLMIFEQEVFSSGSLVYSAIKLIVFNNIHHDF